jgi:hypothetical protein
MIVLGLRLPASTRELFDEAEDHKKSAIYIALPESVALFLSPALMSRGCSVFRTIMRHFPRRHGALLAAYEDFRANVQILHHVSARPVMVRKRW